MFYAQNLVLAIIVFSATFQVLTPYTQPQFCLVLICPHTSTLRWFIIIPPAPLLPGSKMDFKGQRLPGGEDRAYRLQARLVKWGLGLVVDASYIIYQRIYLVYRYHIMYFTIIQGTLWYFSLVFFLWKCCSQTLKTVQKKNAARHKTKKRVDFYREIRSIYGQS